jgi:hypothetical protein
MKYIKNVQARCHTNIDSSMCAIAVTGDDARLYFCVVKRLQTGEEAL